MGAYLKAHHILLFMVVFIVGDGAANAAAARPGQSLYTMPHEGAAASDPPSVPTWA